VSWAKASTNIGKKELYHSAMCIGPPTILLTSIFFSYWVHKPCVWLSCEELKSTFEVARKFHYCKVKELSLIGSVCITRLAWLFSKNWYRYPLVGIHRPPKRPQVVTPRHTLLVDKAQWKFKFMPYDDQFYVEASIWLLFIHTVFGLSLSLYPAHALTHKIEGLKELWAHVLTF
jgi:hypothetical protein